jgi:cytochrome c
MMKTWWVMKISGVAVIALAASIGPGRAQDATAGEAVFKRLCSPCHDIGPEAKIKLGPPLNGIDGRHSGSFEGFNYSQANKSSGITWNQETFTKYIHAPMQEMPGTRMAFVGIKNDKDIADLWAYLAEFGPDGQKKK